MPPVRQPEWWQGYGLAPTQQAMAPAIQERLEFAVRRWGYSNPSEAEKHLEPEVWAAIKRFGGTWDEVCQDSGPNAIRCLARDIAIHLVAVKIGDRRSLAEADRFGDELRRSGFMPRQPAAPKDPDAPLDGTEAIHGRDLALLIAHIVGGDADLCPAAEVRNIRIVLGRATDIIQELLKQWRDTQTNDKALFCRTLLRRLRDNQTAG